MDRIVVDFFFFPVADVFGDNMIVGHDANTVDRTDNCNIVMCVFGRNRVVVAVESH